MTRWLVPLLKLLVVAALFAYVAHSITWHDTLIETSADGTVSGQITGTIVGTWDSPRVQFRPDGDPDRIVTVDRSARNLHLDPGFGTYFRQIDPWLFAMALLLQAMATLLAALRWWWFLTSNQLRLGWAETLRLYWLGLFFNNFVPGATGGDLVRAAWVARRFKGNRLRAFLSVFVDRAVGLVSMLLFAAIMSLFYLDVFAEIAAALWLALVTIVLVSGVYLAPRIRRTLGVDRIVKRLPGRVRIVAAEVDAAFLHYRGHLAGIGLWIAAGPLIYGCAAAGLLLVDRALGVGLDLTEYLLLMPLVAIVTAVPIAPNGWGIGEAVYGNLIARLGAPLLGDAPHAVATMRTRGVALSIVSRIILTLISLAGGLFLLRRSGRASLAEARAGAEGPDARSAG